MKKIIVAGVSAAMLSLFAAGNATAEPKTDAAFAFSNRPASEFRMRGARLGVYDENLFFGGEQQQEELGGETNNRNLAAARVPVYFDGDKWLRAELTGAEEKEQSALGARLRFFFDCNHSLGPIVESLTKNNANTTHYGLQGHIEKKGVRIEGGLYNTVIEDDIETIVNGAVNFTGQEHHFGIGYKLSEESQWYGIVALNETGSFGYRVKLYWEPTAEKTLQQIILSSDLLYESDAYYPIAPREGGLTNAGVVPEYPIAPCENAGVAEWFLPTHYTRGWGAEITHSADSSQNTESINADTALYPLAYVESPEPFRNFFVGAEWNRTRTGNETETSTTAGVGYDYRNFRAVYRQEEGSKGESYGYVMWSAKW